MILLESQYIKLQVWGRPLGEVEFNREKLVVSELLLLCCARGKTILESVITN